MPSCVVKGCSRASRRGDSGVILHVFPKDKVMITKWLLATGQHFEDLMDFVNRIHKGKKTDTYRMCSLHFSPESYRYQTRKLMPNAVPSIFIKKTPGKKNPAPARPEIQNPKIQNPKIRKKKVARVCLKPGERCPTCSQLIPENLSPQNGEGETQRAEATYPTQGITNRIIQETIQWVVTKAKRNEELAPHSSASGPEQATVLNPNRPDQDDKIAGYNPTPRTTDENVTIKTEPPEEVQVSTIKTEPLDESEALTMKKEPPEEVRVSTNKTEPPEEVQVSTIKTEPPNESKELTIKMEPPEEVRVSTITTEPDRPGCFTVKIEGPDGIQSFTIKIERPDEF
ncbi:uncharacterized protein [Engystomops pustulosus]|uniref:uncharacterized protein n=1 Tax=Engystomops pustulosus TaxID=76066 RepID=UPI003AFA789C